MLTAVKYRGGIDSGPTAQQPASLRRRAASSAAATTAENSEDE